MSRLPFYISILTGGCYARVGDVGSLPYEDFGTTAPSDTPALDDTAEVLDSPTVPPPESVYVSPSLGTMALIEAGSFTMGCLQGRDDLTVPCESNEAVLRVVTLGRSFYMMEHEVTQSAWSAVMGANPSRRADCGLTCPVESVSWNEVQTFIAAASELDGQAYRLPTEAEWEYAARAGGGELYAGSNDLESVGWYSENATGSTQPVCAKSRNAFGLCDMSGNVFEWTADWYGAYPASDETDPSGPASGTFRVSRGGGWNYDAPYARVANRSGNSPDDRTASLGFRLVLSTP